MRPKQCIKSILVWRNRSSDHLLLPLCFSRLRNLDAPARHHRLFSSQRPTSQTTIRRSRCNPPPPSSFAQDVDRMYEILRPLRQWSYEAEESLKSLPFQINSAHVHELLKRRFDRALVSLCFFLWVRNLRNYKHTNLTYNNAVHIAVKEREFKFIEKIVSEYLKEDGCVLGTITCNVVIKEYGKARKVEEAFAFFSRMDGCILSKPNIWTCNLLLHILIKENELDWACNFYHKVLSYGFQRNSCTCNIWMLYLCKKNELDEARRWLEEMPCPPNKVSFGTLIDGFCKAGRMEEASSLFVEMMEKSDISPDVYVFSSLIDGYCKAEMLDEAWKLLKVMDSEGIKPNVVTYTTIIDGMLKVGKTSAALGLLEYMGSTGCVPNEYLCTSRIDSLCKNGQLDEARDFLKHMAEVGCKPNTVTYCALIDGHLKAGHEEEAMKLVTEMSAHGFAPDGFLYSSLIYAFGKAGDDDKAKTILEESLSKHSSSTPDTRIMNCWLSGLCRSNRVDQAYHLFTNLNAEGFVPNTVTHNILITGFAKSNRIGYARVVFEGIQERNCSPDLSSYTNMIKGYCKTGAVNHACDWLLQSFEKGFVHVFRFHVYTILDIFMLRKSHHARSFLELLGSHCKFTAEVDRSLYMKLLEAEDSDTACKAVAVWKRLRTQ